MRRFHETVEQRLGPGEYIIQLEPAGLGGFRRMSSNSGPGRYRKHLTLGSYPRRGLSGAVNAGQLLATGASIGTSVGLASTIGVWAGPVGAAAGAIVGIIAGLFAASAARAKGAKEENDAINEYLPAWDQSLQAIFQQANAGLITAAAAQQACASLMPYWWQAAAQFHGLPGVADASNGGANCGTYVPGQTTACSPTGGPNCDKSCTAFCCIGCRDLMPSVAYAQYLFGLPTGGSLNVCTVYSSKYGASQRNSYTLTYTPPAPGTAAGTLSTATSALSSLTGSGSTILGIPAWLLLLAGAVAAYEFI